MDGGDVDGDGLRDLAIGYPDAEGKAGGRLALIPGPVESDAVVEDVATIWLGSSPAIHFAEAVSIVGDADGDGTGDIAVGAWDASELFEDGGAAYLIHGGALIPAERSVDDVDLKIESENAFDSLGDAVSGLGDLDGDGLAEIGVTATRSSGNVDGTVPARVYLVRSPPAGGVVSAGDLDAALIGSVDEEVVAYGYAFSSLLAGGADTDLDGTPEFLVGSPLFDGEYYERVGRVDLIEGWPF
jgi:hypothetical protein